MRLREEAITWRQVDDEVVVLDLDNSVYLSINASGRLLWERLVQGAGRGELVDLLAEEYSLDRSSATADVDEFLAELRRNRLLAGSVPGSA